MANTLDPMDLKQIVTLHLDGHSNRSIGTALSISRNTVNTYMVCSRGATIPLRNCFPLRMPVWKHFSLPVPLSPTVGTMGLIDSITTSYPRLSHQTQPD